MVLDISDCICDMESDRTRTFAIAGLSSLVLGPCQAGQDGKELGLVDRALPQVTFLLLEYYVTCGCQPSVSAL